MTAALVGAALAVIVLRKALFAIAAGACRRAWRLVRAS